MSENATVLDLVAVNRGCQSGLKTRKVLVGRE